MMSNEPEAELATATSDEHPVIRAIKESAPRWEDIPPDVQDRWRRLLDPRRHRD